MDVIANRTATISVDLIEGDDYISLDSTNGDKVTYTLLDGNGEVVGGVSDETYKFSGEISSLELSFDESCNTLNEGEMFDYRYVIVSYTRNKKSKIMRLSYRVIPFLPYTVSEDDVYSLIGVSRSVIPETTIDIFGSYMILKEGLGDMFTSAFLSKNESAIKANRALLLRTALGLEHAVILGVPKTETDNIVSQTHFDLKLADVKALFDDIRNELKDLTAELSGESGDYEVAAFLIPQYTDPYTGEG